MSSRMFTLTINQTDSRRDGDRVPQLLKDLRHIPARLDFDRSVEDEVQGILDCPHQTVEEFIKSSHGAEPASVPPLSHKAPDRGACLGVVLRRGGPCSEPLDKIVCGHRPREKPSLCDVATDIGEHLCRQFVLDSLGNDR